MAASPAPFQPYKERAEVHIVIAGCGRVGSELASNLQRLGQTVAVIHKSRKARDRLKSDFSSGFLVGFVFDRDILETAGIKGAAASASVTSGDNSNIVSSDRQGALPCPRGGGSYLRSAQI
jgi:trk system potassium uptake protein TrkA